MHRWARWHFWLNVLISFLFVGGAWLLVQFNTPLASAAGNANNVRGWARVVSLNAGWISLSSLNTEICPSGNTCTPSYGLTLTLDSGKKPTGGSISGWAWAGKASCNGGDCQTGQGGGQLGWMCFGSTCTGSPPASALAGVSGDLVRFDCVDASHAVQPCDDASVTFADVYGWAQFPKLGGQGWVLLPRYSQLPSPNWVQLVFGTAATSPQNILQGYAWHYAGGNQATVSQNYGLGWVQFSPSSQALFPYFQVKGGDLYSQGGVSTLFFPPATQYNAQYLIHVGTAGVGGRVVSQCAVQNTPSASACEQTSLPFGLPACDTSPYNFQLGRFDFIGLTQATAGVNKYNMTVVNGLPASNQSLNGQVYYVTGDTTITNTLTFMNGTSTNPSGSGTIVVNGNLTFGAGAAVQYDSSALQPGDPRRYLPSVAWIVLGDVQVDPSITQLAGTFIILGKHGNQICTTAQTNGNYYVAGWTPSTTPTSCTGGSAVCTGASVGGDQCQNQCKAYTDTTDASLLPGNGHFVSCYNPGTPDACAQSALQVSGSVFARQFDLGRTYVNVSTQAPAEQFQADGRLQLNPPPGFADFAKGLPTFSRQ